MCWNEYSLRVLHVKRNNALAYISVVLFVCEYTKCCAMNMPRWVLGGGRGGLNIIIWQSISTSTSTCSCSIRTIVVWLHLQLFNAFGNGTRPIPLWAPVFVSVFGGDCFWKLRDTCFYLSLSDYMHSIWAKISRTMAVCVYYFRKSRTPDLVSLSVLPAPHVVWGQVHKRQLLYQCFT